VSVVFTDNFTVAADTNIDAYPSGSPDYAYNNGSGTNFTVNAANDRVQDLSTTTTVAARIIDAAVPTGDQEITADCFSNTTDNSGGVAARMATAGTQNYYSTYLEQNQANECRLHRLDTGTEVLLDSVDAGFSGGSARSHRLKVTGAGATVTVEWQIGTMAARSVGDTAANRKTSGPPGIIGYNGSPNVIWVDNVSVDNLITGAIYTVLNSYNVAGSLTTGPLALTMQQSLAFATAGGLTQGGAHAAILNSALIQAAALALTETLSIEQILALGMNANIDTQLGRELTQTLALACAVDLAEQHSLLRTVSATLALQAAIALSTTANLESSVALTQTAMLTPTALQTGTLNVSLIGTSDLSALADLLGQLQMSIALTSTGTLTVVEQFTAIGQITLAAQTMTSIAAQQTAQVILTLAQQVGEAVSETLARAMQIGLTGGAAIAVLTDALRVYLVSVGLGTIATLTVAEQHALALTVVESVTPVLEAQQHAQFATLIALGVQSAQAVAATATMQMFATIGLQTLLIAAAQLVGINAPQIIRLVNEQLLHALLAHEQVGRAQLTNEVLSQATLSGEKIVK
jgi:hypothetical protein